MRACDRTMLVVARACVQFARTTRMSEGRNGKEKRYTGHGKDRGNRRQREATERRRFYRRNQGQCAKGKAMLFALLPLRSMPYHFDKFMAAGVPTSFPLPVLIPSPPPFSRSLSRLSIHSVISSYDDLFSFERLCASVLGNRYSAMCLDLTSVKFYLNYISRKFLHSTRCPTIPDNSEKRYKYR